MGYHCWHHDAHGKMIRLDLRHQQKLRLRYGYNRLVNDGGILELDLPRVLDPEA